MQSPIALIAAGDSVALPLGFFALSARGDNPGNHWLRFNGSQWVGPNTLGFVVSLPFATQTGVVDTVPPSGGSSLGGGSPARVSWSSDAAANVPGISSIALLSGGQFTGGPQGADGSVASFYVFQNAPSVAPGNYICRTIDVLWTSVGAGQAMSVQMDSQAPGVGVLLGSGNLSDVSPSFSLAPNVAFTMVPGDTRMVLGCSWTLNAQSGPVISWRVGLDAVN